MRIYDKNTEENNILDFKIRSEHDFFITYFVQFLRADSKYSQNIFYDNYR